MLADIVVPGGITAIATALPAITLVSAVPEASAWAMLLAGFAGLGFVGFRPRRRSAVP